MSSTMVACNLGKGESEAMLYRHGQICVWENTKSSQKM